MFICRFCFHHAKRFGLSAGSVFGYLRKAFCFIASSQKSLLDLCFVKRSELGSCKRLVAQVAKVYEFNCILSDAYWSLAKFGIQCDLLVSINDWHTLTWSTVQDQDTYQL